MPEKSIHALLAQAISHHQAGNLAQADHDYRAVLHMESNHADAWHLRGVLAHQLGKFADACEFITRALNFSQRPGLYLFSLGLALAALNRMAEAEAAYREALAQDSQQILWWRNLAHALVAQGKLAETAQCCQTLLQLDGQDAAAYKLLGNVYDVSGEAEAALACYRAALAIQTDDAETYNNLGISLSKLGRYSDAETSLRVALSLNPNFVEAHNNLGMALREQGKQAEAITSFRAAIALSPRHTTAQRNLLTTLLYQSGLSQDELFAAHQYFEATLAQPLYPHQKNWHKAAQPRKTLRVGWLSSDLRDHPVARNIYPLLAHQDRSRFEHVLYADLAQADVMSGTLAECAFRWHSIYGLPDSEVAQLIRSDEIDVLICLAGHFDNNRPLVCAFKPAPVQISFHDAATSGLRAVDYLISDINLTPRHGRERFTERVVRLPTFYVHSPLSDAPPVNTRATSEQGAVVFANFGNPAKINAAVIALWSQVLNALPQSRLMLKYKNVYGDETVRADFEARFAIHGVSASRLIWHGQSPTNQAHLALYHEADITLDSFPFNGSTTTFESLWMGVPVLTLCGENMVGRWGAAMLRRAGLEEWIAQSAEDFVTRAVRLASESVGLRQLRGSLRERIAASPLCATQTRARQFERLLRALWQRYIRTHPR